VKNQDRNKKARMIRRAFLSSLRYTASHTSAVAPRSHRRIPTDLCYGLARIMGSMSDPVTTKWSLMRRTVRVVIAELRRLLHSS
jgi:hypothetical protein